MTTDHRVNVRASLPTVNVRRLNQGSATSKAVSRVFDEQCAMVEAWSEVDAKLAAISGDEKMFRINEASAFIEAMGQKAADLLFYGDSDVNPEEIKGFAARFNSLSGDVGDQIIDGGGSDSDLMSAWLIGWGENTVFGTYPKGSKNGLVHEDKGAVTLESAGGVEGARMDVLRDKFGWDLGLVVKDYRFVSRCPNIDVSLLTSENAAATNLIKSMIKMWHRIPSFSACRAAYYLNRTAFQMLDIQAYNGVSAGGQLGYKEIDGKPMLTFRGLPIRRVDALRESEEAVA